MTNTFRGQDSMWKSTMTIASSIQCLKHQSRRRGDKKRFERSANVFEVAPNRACTTRFVLSKRCPASHAETSESVNQTHIPRQHAHLQKQLFLNQQTARVDNVSLSITSSSTGDGHIETRTGRKEHGMVGSHKFKIRECRPSSRSLAQVMITRCPPFG